MLVVEVGSVLTTLLFLRDLGSATAAENTFSGLVSLWLWFTVLFANFAEAMAEGRGKAQAATLRKTRSETVARVRREDGSTVVLVETPSSALQPGDLCVVTAGEVIPGRRRCRRGDRHRRRVGHHRRVGAGHPRVRRRPVGGHRRDPGPVRRDRGADHRPPGRELPGPDDRARRGRRPSEDTERDRPVHPAGRPDHHLPAGGRHAAALRRLLRRRAADRGAGGPPGLPHPDDHRRACCRPSASPGWTASCSATCWPCPAAPSRPRAT